MSHLGMLLPPSLPPGWVRFEAPVEHPFDYNGSCVDETHESHRITDGVPGGAHPTAGAPFVSLEDESR